MTRTASASDAAASELRRPTFFNVSIFKCACSRGGGSQMVQGAGGPTKPAAMNPEVLVAGVKCGLASQNNLLARKQLDATRLATDHGAGGRGRTRVWRSISVLPGGTIDEERMCSECPTPAPSESSWHAPPDVSSAGFVHSTSACELAFTQKIWPTATCWHALLAWTPEAEQTGWCGVLNDPAWLHTTWAWLRKLFARTASWSMKGCGTSWWSSAPVFVRMYTRPSL